MFYTWSGVFWSYLRSGTECVAKMEHHNRIILFSFSLGPSVKLVSPFIDAFSNNNKNGGWGGRRGVCPSETLFI